MSYLNLPQKQALEQERWNILQHLENWLELPMLLLSGVWIALFVIELIWGLNPFLNTVGIVIWLVFVFEFSIKFLLAPRKGTYLRQKWLMVLSLILPALRVFRFVRILKALQTARAVRGVRLLQVMTRTNRGMQALANSFNRRGFGYVLGLTTIVIGIGAAGMYAFERVIPETALTDYGTALWWTAMLISTMGSDYFPKSPEGRVLCFLLAIYAFAVFGYVTATLATFFIDRDAENPEAEVAGATAIADLQAEVAALRAEIQALTHYVMPRENEPLP